MLKISFLITLFKNGFWKNKNLIKSEISNTNASYTNIKNPLKAQNIEKLAKFKKSDFPKAKSFKTDFFTFKT